MAMATPTLQGLDEQLELNPVPELSWQKADLGCLGPEVKGGDQGQGRQGNLKNVGLFSILIIVVAAVYTFTKIHHSEHLKLRNFIMLFQIE